MADEARALLDVRGGDNPADGSDLVRRAPSAPVRGAALGVAGLALLATIRADVPVVSGLAVALMVPAALVDLRERRLPDRIVGPTGLLVLLGTLLSRLLGVDISFPAGLVGALAFAGPLLLLHLVSPTAMGFGDVKAGIVLGYALGLVHWHLALAALALATGLTAAVGLLARVRTVAFGPGLVVAAALALAAAPHFAPLDGERGAPEPPPARPTGVHR